LIPHARLAELAAAAYEPPPTYQRADVCVTITNEGGILVVAFQGTRNIAEAIRDAEALPHADAVLGEVHLGFAAGSRLVALDIAFKLADTTGPPVFTGHSLGGALALMTAALWRCHGSKVGAVVTFGAPRAGFQSFCDKLDDVDITMYRFGCDGIPEVPRLLPFWRHPRVLTLIGRQSGNPLSDHHITNYVRALAKTEEQSTAVPSGQTGDSTTTGAGRPALP